ncbi:Hachiman antiphage defense system protein HamA [Desertivirga xinjiangensis]|uniref:Hachiman antiphage defense system protein HamA n=1 Tax=Desertivirga xinjiangensis TaxID=539206 RepID=UPI00210B4A03|nr:Hachiman antiphage defense system protein HamA [Pedobacter xinjiangensis]
MDINWEAKIQIDKDWVERQLITHFEDKKLKIAVRGYTPKVIGNQFSCSSIIEELNFMLSDYVNSSRAKKREYQALLKKYGKDLADKRLDVSLNEKAKAFFGATAPDSDGKFGELLLFALTESILKCKMVAHKISGLSNGKDQVKGGDGIFLGNYERSDGSLGPAIFIGESKIKQGFSDAVGDAFTSIDRFHAAKTKAEFTNMEFIVANNTLFTEEGDDDFEEIFDRLTPGTASYATQIWVHPVLIMYNTAKITSFEQLAASPEQLEVYLKDFMMKEKEAFLTKINTKITDQENIKKIYLDFFIFPFNDVKYFRDGMYFAIHNMRPDHGK